MTEEQKTAIQDLRSKGEGYKKIAQELGLPPNTIKSFCRRMQMPKTETVPEGDTCECCGKSIKQTTGRKHKRFCSDACRHKWWNSHLHLVQRRAVYRLKCQHCGREFEVYGNSHRKYCCHACYIAERFGGRKSGASCACARTKSSMTVGVRA